jgi:DNA-binding beta-propeller fold protein YncE
MLLGGRVGCSAPLPLIVALLAVSALGGSSAEAQQFYRLESAVTIKSSSPNWDYLTFEPKRSYLYIARREDGVTVYNANTKKLREIANCARANAITLVSELDRGYTTNEDGSTTVFQLSSLKALRRIKIAESADSAAYEPVTGQLVFTAGDSRKIIFFDPRSELVSGTLEVESAKLEHPTPDGAGSVFLAQRDRDSVVRIDAKLRRATAEWKTEGCEEPNGLAFDRVNQRLFVGCRGKGKDPRLVVLNSESGRIVATAEIGRGNDGVIYDAESRKIYTSNGIDSNLVVIDQLGADTYSLAEAATTRPYARTMALDPRTKKIYLVTAEGTVDPAKKVNRSVAPFYPNTFFSDTFTVLTYSPRQPAHASVFR